MNVKFGAMMGANLAVACVLMQGCKAPQAGGRNAEPAYKTVAAKPAAAAAAPAKPVFPDKPVAAKPVAAKPAESVVVVEELPPPAPKPAVAEPETTTYVVRRGDYLAKICKTYNIKMSAVLKANPGLDADKIRIGQKLKLPGKVDVAPAPVPVEVAPGKKPAAKPAAAKSAYVPYTGATKEYVVKNGDMLGSIALTHGISIRALKELNGLEAGPKGNALKVNQKLKVPAEKVVATAAKVEKDKNAVAPAVAPVAASAAAPEAQKPEAPQDAQPAEKPEEAQPAAAEQPESPTGKQVDEIQKDLDAAPAAEQPAAASGVTTYVVGPDEDVVSIAIKNSVTPSMILDMNNLSDATVVKPGMVLKIPAAPSEKAQ